MNSHLRVGPATYYAASFNAFRSVLATLNNKVNNKVLLISFVSCSPSPDLLRLVFAFS